MDDVALAFTHGVNALHRLGRPMLRRINGSVSATAATPAIPDADANEIGVSKMGRLVLNAPFQLTTMGKVFLVPFALQYGSVITRTVSALPPPATSAWTHLYPGGGLAVGTVFSAMAFQHGYTGNLHQLSDYLEDWVALAGPLLVHSVLLLRKEGLVTALMEHGCFYIAKFANPYLTAETRLDALTNNLQRAAVASAIAVGTGLLSTAISRDSTFGLNVSEGMGLTLAAAGIFSLMAFAERFGKQYGNAAAEQGA